MAGNYTIPYAPQQGFDWTGGANDNIVRLMMEQGRIAGDRAQRSGEIWGNAIGNIGKIASGAIQDYGEKRDEQKKRDALAKRDVAWVSFISSPEAEDPKKLLAQATSLYGPDGPKMASGVEAAQRLHTENARKDQDSALKDFGAMIGSGDVMDTGARAHLWPVLHAAALKNPEALSRIGLTPDQIPDQYPGDETWQSTISRIGKKLRGEPDKAAEGFTLSPGQERYDASGNVIATAAAAPKEDKKYLVTVPGPNGPIKKLATEEELAAGVKEYQQPDKPPAPKWVEMEDENGKRVLFDETSGQRKELPEDLRAKPSTTEANRMASAAAALSASGEIRSYLGQEDVKKAIGPLVGRYNSLAQAAGVGDPVAIKLVAMLRSYSALQPNIHGFRAVKFAEDIEKLLTTKQEPANIIAALDGIDTAAKAVGSRGRSVGETVTITNDAEWAKLAPGTHFIDPDGKERIK